jgi:hypothetical protein
MPGSSGCVIGKSERLPMQFKVCEISHRQQKSGSLQTNFTHPSQ